MKQQRVFVRFVLLVFVVITGMLSGPFATGALAQTGTSSFVSPMTGITIEASGPWSIDTSTVLTEGGVESVLVEGQYEFMQVWFMPGDLDLVEARDVILDSFAITFGSFVTIDRGAYGNVSYSLDMTSSEGIEFGVFSLFLGQRASGYVEYYVYFGAVPVFASGFASAQQNVRVGGNPVFEGVDGSGLQDILIANQGATGATSQTQTAPPTPAPEQPAPTQPPVDTAPTQPPAEPAPTANTTGQTAQAPAVDSAYIESIRAETSMLQGSLDAFLIDYIAFLEGTDPDEDALLDRLVGTLDMWTTYPDTAAGLVPPPGYEDVDAAYQQLAGDFAAASAQFQTVISLFASDDSTGGAAAFDEFLVQVDGLYTQIETVNGLLDQHGQGGATTEVPAETPVPEPTAVPVETPAPEPTEIPAETPVPEPTEVTTQAPVDDPADEPQDISETGSRGGLQDRPSPSTQTPNDYEDLGLVADDEYLSPQFDLEILWDDNWEFDPDIVDEPIASNEADGIDWITLAWLGGGMGDITLTLGDQPGFDPATMTEYWESAEYTDQFDAPTEVRLADLTDDRGAVLLLLDGGSDQLVIYKEAVCLDRRCGEYALITIFALVDDAADVIADAEDGITIDGIPATEVFSFREIRNALDD